MTEQREAWLNSYPSGRAWLNKLGSPHTKKKLILQQKNDAEIRLGNDKRGKIIKNPDGTYGIAWKVELTETFGLRDSATGQKRK